MTRESTKKGDHIRMKRRRFLRRRLPYSANGTASFNPSLLENNLSGDIHPHPEPNSTSNFSSTSANTNKLPFLATRSQTSRLLISISAPWSPGNTSLCWRILLSQIVSTSLRYQRHGWILQSTTRAFIFQATLCIDKTVARTNLAADYVFTLRKTTKFHHWRMYPQFLIITFSNCG